MTGFVSLPSLSLNSMLTDQISSSIYKQVPHAHAFSMLPKQQSQLTAPYSALFRKNTVFLSTMFAGAFAFEMCVPLDIPTHTRQFIAVD